MSTSDHTSDNSTLPDDVTTSESNKSLLALTAKVDAHKKVVAQTPEGHPEQATHLHRLAISLRERYERSGHLEDLTSALHSDQAAVRLTPEGHPDHAAHLSSLAASFTDHYQRFGDLNYLEAALQNDRAAVQLIPKEHPSRPVMLQGLAVSLTDRYDRLGDVSDLEAALQNNQEAVALTPTGHPDRAGYLSSLAASFTECHQRSGELKDLKLALHFDQEAVDAAPEGHPYRAILLHGLAVSFRDYYQRLGDLKDLQNALQNFQAAVDLTPRITQIMLNVYKAWAYLEAAQKARQKAVKQTPDDSPDLAGRIQDLARSFSDRYQKLGDLKDLEVALENFQTAVMLTPKGSVTYPARLKTLGASLIDRYEKLEDPKDLEAALETFKLAVTLTPKDHPDHAVHLKNLATAFAHRYDKFKDVNDLNAALQYGKECVDLTPAGHPSRSSSLQNLALTFLDRYTRFGDPNDLEATYDNCRASLDGPTATPLNSWRTALKWAYLDICMGIRNGIKLQLEASTSHWQPQKQSGLSKSGSYTHPPCGLTATEVALQQAILKDVLKHCNIRARMSDSSRLFGRQEPFTSKPIEESFKDLLAWLWSNIVVHVYKTLESHGVHGDRLWWCPTVLYTNIGGLIEAISKEPSGAPQKVGVVGVTHSGPSGSSNLPGVHEEVKKITSIVGKESVQILVGAEATVESVKSQLRDCSWVHLACHGKQDLYDPPKSCLQLYEGTLELETILRMPLPHSEVVILAACQTAMGDTELANESFHLGGGFLAAGFRGAIGTMWSMLDRDGPVVAEAVYSYLFGNGRKPDATDAAKALQLAIRKMRNDGIPYERWVPFIHIGV
ncbi:CHAT domain-containing protein [Mycena sp. CBHHK59/15]|nr:CHAT domain-containing protein [Mycena sp. CBHHK59/15]